NENGSFGNEPNPLSFFESSFSITVCKLREIYGKSAEGIENAGKRRNPGFSRKNETEGGMPGLRDCGKENAHERSKGFAIARAVVSPEGRQQWETDFQGVKGVIHGARPAVSLVEYCDRIPWLQLLSESV